MYKITINRKRKEPVVEKYNRLCEATDRMAVLFFQEGIGVMLEIKQISRGE